MEPKERALGIYKVTLVGSIVNFLLVALKFVAGIWGHSAAMVADAVPLSDLVTDVIVMVNAMASVIEQKLKEQYGEDTHIGIHVEPIK